MMRLTLLRPVLWLSETQEPDSYYFSFGYQNISSIGLGGYLTIHRPTVKTGSSSSAILYATNANNNVQVGWIVDTNLNSGSIYPYLFVNSNGGSQGSCYNGCGFVQISRNIFPGRQVTLSSVPILFRIQYFSGNWWVGYKTEWFGYFPGSLWSNRFTSSTRALWSGAVRASIPATCTDMGNGYRGTNISPIPAYMNDMFTYRLGGLRSDALASYSNTNTAYYNTSAISGKYFRYGGPGAC